ncbi:MAG: DEAD/DEAH box helicase, partial [Betaproteobacteria bacterium]
PPPELPASPYDIAAPASRWRPAADGCDYDALVAPLVERIREEVAAWRATGYSGASPTTTALLAWWFDTEHRIEEADGALAPFRYYFAQREAVETVVWLYEVRRARDKFDLLRFSASAEIRPSLFDEDWTRYVVKMATGAGKTKVLSLLLAWSYFHKLYEPQSALARNFLLIAPNIIVLDRLRSDFDGLRIFFADPVLPDNGHAGRNWRDDFQIALHIRDEVRVARGVGNLFLTNIHRVYLGAPRAAGVDDDDLTDYFLAPFGPRPVGKTTDSRIDLAEIVREVDELVVFNDEAHHIHDPRMAWFKSIQDIHHRMLQRDCRLALQVDVTATPRHDNGAIFVQTVSDYPLVEAIRQDVVKHPILPDAASRAQLREAPSAVFSERYRDYLLLGLEEWRASRAEHAKLGKKAVLFVMVDDTRNCDDVGAALQLLAPELQGKVLVIHTKNNGEIAEAAGGKDNEELARLRAEANSIDTWANPHEAIVSVMMLREGWDVRNVTTIVGLRAYVSPANILPEQTLGRGLRRMYPGGDVRETVSVIGTDAFVEFVERIQREGVTLERAPMGAQRRADALTIEVDAANPDKDVAALDIALPLFTRRHEREFRALDTPAAALPAAARLPLAPPTAGAARSIAFKTLLDGELDHVVELDAGADLDWRAVVGFFARQLAHELGLVAQYETVYRAVRDFVRDGLFAAAPVDLDDPAVVHSLAGPLAGQLVYDTVKAALNAASLRPAPVVRRAGELRLTAMRPFRVAPRGFLAPRKSVVNRIVGEAHADALELKFAAFLDAAADVAAFGKNSLAVGLRLDYVRRNGDLAQYLPDFIVRTADGRIWIVETKGRAELDLPAKMARLAQWCADATEACAGAGGPGFGFVYVDEAVFERLRPSDFAQLVAACRDFQL